MYVIKRHLLGQLMLLCIETLYVAGYTIRQAHRFTKLKAPIIVRRSSGPNHRLQIHQYHDKFC